MHIPAARRIVAPVAAFALVTTAFLATSTAATRHQHPGARPSGADPAAVVQPNTDGLHTVVNETGHISKSIAGTSSATSAGGTVTVHKPAGATVRNAYLAYATTGFTDDPLTSNLTLDGQPVPLTNQVTSGIESYNYFADVTNLVKTKTDAAPAGNVSFTIVEPIPSLVDGEILTVIYDDPAVTVDRSVTLLYGALSPAGDSYHIALAHPIDLSDPDTYLEMSLGISYSYQEGGDQQYSIVNVNGQRMTTAAGGSDDGAPANGQLITVGGEGDSIADPADPYATPTNARSDDELYNLLPFVHNGDTSIAVTTDNPSFDDNVFFSAFTANPPITSVGSGSATKTTLSATPNSVAFGAPVTFTAHVAKAQKHAGRPAGNVNFYLNGSATAIATEPLTVSTGNAGFSTNGLPAGVDTVTAVYAGNATFDSSASDPVTVTVGGTHCTVTGAHVGTITVAARTSVTLCNATVRGSVVVQTGGAVDIENSTIRDGVVAYHTSALRMCGSSSQLVAVSTSDGFVMVGDPDDGCATNIIRGDLYLKDNTHGVQVIDNYVTGTVTDQNNTGAGPYPNDTEARVYGNGTTSS